MASFGGTCSSGDGRRRHHLISQCACGSLQVMTPVGPFLQNSAKQQQQKRQQRQQQHEDRCCRVAAPYTTIDCHCRYCRKYHAGAFVSYLVVPAKDVMIVGETARTYTDRCDEIIRVAAAADATNANGLGSGGGAERDTSGATNSDDRGGCRVVDRIFCGQCYCKLASRPHSIDDDDDGGSRYKDLLLVNMGPLQNASIPPQLAKRWKVDRVPKQLDSKAVWLDSIPLAEWDDDDEDDDEDGDDEDEDEDEDDDEDGEDGDDEEDENEENGDEEDGEADNINTDNNRICSTDLPPGSRIVGGCACGDCRFAIDYEPPTEINHCYCSLCRKYSGAAFVSWVPIESEVFHWTSSSSSAAGGVEPTLMRTIEGSRRHVCTRCGSAFTMVYDDDPDTTWPAAGCFDDRCLPSSTDEMNRHLHGVAHIHVASKQKWYQLPKDGLPRENEG